MFDFVNVFQEWIDLGCVQQTTKQIQDCTGNGTLDMAVNACLCSPSNYTFNSMLDVNCTNTTNTAVAELYF